MLPEPGSDGIKPRNLRLMRINVNACPWFQQLNQLSSRAGENGWLKNGSYGRAEEFFVGLYIQYEPTAWYGALKSGSNYKLHFKKSHSIQNKGLNTATVYGIGKVTEH